MSHWFTPYDIYQEKYADGTVLSGTAEDWCLMGQHDKRPLYCGHQIHQMLHLYQRASPTTANVVELSWSATTQHDQAYDIVAHDHAVNTDPNRTHVIKIVMASGL